MSERHEDRIVYLPCSAPESELRFHLDENVARAVADALRTQGFDVTTTHDAGLRSKSDDTQMAYAHEAQRVLVTRDKGFLHLCRAERAHAGVVYWPHGRATKSREMQALLIELLRRIVQSPDRAAEISPHTQRSRRGKGQKRKALPVPGRTSVSRNLPGGYLVRGTVQTLASDGAQVLLAGGQHAIVLPHRLPVAPLLLGDEIEAVTVVYVRSSKTLHLSLRRHFALARTMPLAGVRLLRRNDHQWQKQLEQRRPVEIVVEAPHQVRVFGATADAVRATAADLEHEVPWTASAVIHPDAVPFKAWVKSTFGSMVKFAQATGAALHGLHDGRLLVCAATNRELDHVLNLVQHHVPGTELCQLQAARTETLHACAWPDWDDAHA